MNVICIKIIANPYSGLGGIVYALLKAQKYFDKNFSDEILQICGQYMNTQHFFGDRIAAYYMYLDGNLGLHVVNSIFHFIKNESNDISKIIKKVAAQKYSRHHAINKGRCGLLAAILTLKLEANQETNLDDKVLQEVLSNVINVGLEFSKEHSMEAPLSYSEDKNLGFLNGLYGILQMLLRFELQIH
uniref:Uncharacterized protein n=1 Tax=Panagrolaimus superbus TaxID=310955 RepID=A0A914YF40_9BILA